MTKTPVKRRGRPSGIKDKNNVAKPKRQYIWRTMPAKTIAPPKGRKSRIASSFNPLDPSALLDPSFKEVLYAASTPNFKVTVPTTAGGIVNYARTLNQKDKKEEASVAKISKLGRPKGTKNSPYLLKKPDKLISESFHEAKFKKGAVAGPGRPKGSRNKMTLALAKIGENNVEDVFQRLVDIALGKIIGDAKACKAVIDTAITLRKITPINFELPAPIETTEDLNKFSKKIINMAAEGEMSAEEAMEYGKLCEQELKMMTDTDVVKKIENTCLLVDLIKKGG